MVSLGRETDSSADVESPKVKKPNDMIKTPTVLLERTSF
jgi:hypothetical protein